MDLRIQTIYDSGMAKFLEDGLVVQAPFFGVMDGVSGLYDPTAGPRLFNGRSGGQKAIEIMNEAFVRSNDSDELSAVVKKVNDMLREFSGSHGIDMNRADLLSGTTFAFAKISEDKVEVIQGGDCYAVWEKISGEIVTTANQNFFDEEEKIGILNGIIEKNRGDLGKSWVEFMPISAKLRIERVNSDLEKRTIVLNGQLKGEGSWNKIILPRKDLKTLILFTDGMTEFSESRDTDVMGKAIFAAYHTHGLAGMLLRIRDIENKRTQTTHIKHAEATALAIEL
jgi:hypothetical protein